MSDQDLTTTIAGANAEPLESVAEIRRLLHDMNNGLEIIVQAAYLIGTLELKEDGKQWVKLLEQGVEQVANLSQKLREQIRSQQIA